MSTRQSDRPLHPVDLFCLNKLRPAHTCPFHCVEPSRLIGAALIHELVKERHRLDATTERLAAIVRGDAEAPEGRAQEVADLVTPGGR